MQEEWLEYCSDYIGKIHLDGKILDINRFKNGEKNLVVGKYYLDFITPEYQSKVKAVFDSVIKEKKSRSCEYSVVYEGVTKQIKVTYIPSVDDHHNIEYIRFISNDVKILSLQEDIEAIELLSSQMKLELNFFHLIEKQLLDIISICNHEGLYNYVSPSIKHILGYESSDCIGKELTHYYYKEDRERLEHIFSDVIKFSKSEKVEHRMIHKNGSLIWVESTICSVKNSYNNKFHIILITRDIREKKKSEQQLNVAQRIAKIGSWEWDLIKGEDIWSEGFFTLCGYSVAEVTPSYDNFMNLIYEEDKKFVLDYVKTCFSKKADLDFEYRIIRHNDQEVRWVHSKGELNVNDQGEIVATVGTLQDITDEKEVEKALIESEKRLNKAQHLAKIGSWEWDIDKNDIVWSDELYRIYGVDAKTFEPTFEEYLSLIHGDDVTLVKKYLEEALTAKTEMDFIHRIVRPVDHKVIYTHCLGEVLLDKEGKPVKMRGTAQDITEEKEMEKVLLDREAHLKRAQSIGRFGSWEWTIETGKLLWSDHLYEVYGVEKGAYESNYDNFLSLVFHEDLNALNDHISKCLNNKTSINFEHRMKRYNDGRIIYVQCLGEVLCDKNGDPYKIVGSTQDITERKEKEIALMQAEIAKKNAEEVSQLKTDFLTTMSHELRTPLNGIIGFSELMKEGLVGPLNEKQLQYTKEIWNCGQHLLQHITGLLHLSKIEEGKMNLLKEDVDLQEWGDSYLGMIWSLAESKMISILWSLEPDCHVVFVDKLKLTQILYNVLTNAIKFTPKNGQILLAIRKENDDIYFSIKDTGMGIPEADQEIIFEKFKQLDNHSNKHVEGAGIGLSLVKSFVDLHCGKIWVKNNEDGPGCEFVFTLPQKIKEEEVKKIKVVKEG